MIGQYLLNTNETATVSILQNILELNKALGGDRRTKARNEQPTSGAHPRRARSRAGAGRGRGLRGCECVPSCRFFCCEKL